ncbi:MAG: sigma-70 family RNA polymerase sigma factor, partial [Gemmataceae bacterium]|nr:sigma-70 family RNA polymerase sigma factor [Gemmataceae bacterium]
RVNDAFDLELMEMALAEVRARVEEKTWQAFQLSALDGVPAQEVADRLGMGVSQVYLAKHRVSKLAQEEVRKLGGEDPPDGPPA